MNEALRVVAAAPPSVPARETSTQKDLFDHFSMSMVSYLELYDEVTKVCVQAMGNKDCKNEIHIWEKKNFPYKIPNDMQDFYLIFNGVKVTWNVNIAGKHCVIGDFAFLPIEEIGNAQLITLRLSQSSHYYTLDLFRTNSLGRNFFSIS